MMGTEPGERTPTFDRTFFSQQHIFSHQYIMCKNTWGTEGVVDEERPDLRRQNAAEDVVEAVHTPKGEIL